jgi:ketosteroid isomerase-like protein
MSVTEKNKSLLRSRYRQAQLQVIPSMLPGSVEPEAVHKADGSTVISAQDPPGGVDDMVAVIGSIAGWHAQSTAPVFTSYGPMIAEEDCVVEEWETFFHGLDGTMYSNQYCWVKRFDGDQEVEVREYLDSHHAFTVLGLHAPWKELTPPRAPRRHWRPSQSFADAPPLTAMETVFPVRREFELAPAMLRDVQPSGAFNIRPQSDAAGNKKIVDDMRQAQAQGDWEKMCSYYADGFKHFIAGEGPFGWDHLPMEKLYEPLVKHLAGPIQLRLGKMIAENNSVFEEMDVLAVLDDGSVYNNWHCFIHELRDGCIVQTREYMDTHHFWVMLGRWAEWGKAVVPPMRQARRSNLPYVSDTFQGKNPFLQLDRWKAL